MSEPKLDDRHVAELSARLMEVIGRHISNGDPNKTRVYEAINALAVVTATILASTERDLDDARSWFDGAVDLIVVQLLNSKRLEEK